LTTQNTGSYRTEGGTRWGCTKLRQLRPYSPDQRPCTGETERDLAQILTGLLAGLRLDELRRADVGDIRTSTGDGAVIHVRGKAGKDRIVPIEADLLAVIEN